LVLAELRAARRLNVCFHDDSQVRHGIADAYLLAVC
jgi:hypothetical protein